MAASFYQRPYNLYGNGSFGGNRLMTEMVDKPIGRILISNDEALMPLALRFCAK